LQAANDVFSVVEQSVGWEIAFVAADRAEGRSKSPGVVMVEEFVGKSLAVFGFGPYEILAAAENASRGGIDKLKLLFTGIVCPMPTE